MIENISVPMVALSTGPKHHFFGYFDKSPWQIEPDKSTLLLTHETEIYDRMPFPGEKIAVGLIDTSVGREFIRLDETAVWNFQQGAMLQWLPWKEKTIIYNDKIGSELVATIHNIHSGRKHHISRPVAAVSHDGNIALSINFGRLLLVRPDYGYAGAIDPFMSDPCPNEDGIHKIDLKTGNSELLLPLAEIAALGNHGHPPDTFHWVNHLLFNPDDSRFCFLHRYKNSVGTIYTRLLTCNNDGTELHVLISGMASHFDWRTNTELLAWAGERKLLQSTVTGFSRKLPIGRFLKFLYRFLGKPRLLKSSLLNDRFILFQDMSEKQETIGKGLLNCDGHCSFSPDGNWFVTDTYPNNKGDLSLLLYHWLTGKLYKVQDFFSPLILDNEIRCDLHPRWHHDGKRICVDSAHDGTRQMYELDVSNLVTNKFSAEG